MLSILALALGLSAPQTALDQGVAQQQQAVHVHGAAKGATRVGCKNGGDGIRLGLRLRAACGLKRAGEDEAGPPPASWDWCHGRARFGPPRCASSNDYDFMPMFTLCAKKFYSITVRLYISTLSYADTLRATFEYIA